MNKLSIPAEVLIAAAVAFAMGIAKAIAIPERRGIAGFLSACIVGICCGTVAGFISGEFGATSGMQYLASAVFAIFGEKFIFYLLVRTGEITFDHRVDNSTHIGDGATVESIQTGENAKICDNRDDSNDDN